jgi:ABC-2 type transport system ATP-binding protein
LILNVEQVSKKFGAIQAVNHVSLAVEKGKIFGLLGPNGAGKTTLIRMIMDIYQPDEGSIQLGVDAKDRKNHIGYLPEERGLYTKVKVKEALTYFAMLKGLDRKAALERTQYYLNLLEMQATADMQIMKLSKGNQQKIQIISAMVSDPVLLILDEPFSGLDPVNTKMIAECIQMLKSKGVTILLSTHQMNQAETFCDNIFLFHRGRLILEGVLSEIIQNYSGKDWMITADGELPPTDLFSPVSKEHAINRISLAPGTDIRQVLAWLAQQPVTVSGLQPFRLPLSEIFIREVASHV